MNFNPYTPPSSNEDSPHSYITNSPPSDYYVFNPGTPMNMEQLDYQGQYNFGNQVESYDHKQPCLVMIEQPIEKFRFRYKSEMAGTHGCLNGKTSDKTRKQTYPSVELKNFDGPAIVRCSLYQYHSSSKERQPHPHRLIKKVGNEEVDDPHSEKVPTPNTGYVACFHAMGIIHTAKKNLVDELCRKKKFLKEEEIARKEGKRPLRKDEEVSIRHEAEEESKTINMNIVCLRFDAFIERMDGVLIPICPPIYSHGINNLKSALTGELKIVRMDHNSSPAKGNLEIFMLVEKVTKKNIRIRFYELDEDGCEIWSDDGRFTELDVHHQYAIVFRTPPYRDLQITEQRKVYVELMRKSDSSKSEPREFKYYPSPNYQPGMKRSRMSHSYSSGGSFYNSGEKLMPLTITDPNNLPSIDSDEFEKLFNIVGKDFLETPQLVSVGSEDFTLDGPKERYSSPLIKKFDNIQLYDEELMIVERVENEFKSFLATKPQSNLVSSMLVNLFEEHVTVERNNALHLLTKSGNIAKLRCWLEAIKQSDQLQILNARNIDGHTIAHLAALNVNSQQILHLICRYSPDFSVLDNEGNTPLHLAILNNSPLTTIDLLVRSKMNTKLPINAENNESSTALQIAVGKKCLSYVKLLVEHGADVNVTDKKSGYSIVHSAIDVESAEIVKYLVERTNVDLLCRDYKEMTPHQMAQTLSTDGSKTIITICSIIETEMHKRGISTEVYIKEERESDDEMDCDFFECKPEQYNTEELKKMYKNVKSFTSDCLTEVSHLLEISGKWENLAQLLDLQHIVCTHMFAKSTSKAKQLLLTAEKECNLYEIRDFLDILEEHDAVIAMDKMVFSCQPK